MPKKLCLSCLVVGVLAGLAGGWFLFSSGREAIAGDTRYGDYIMTTGPASVGLVGPDLDGVWLLDYRGGRLLGTVVNRVTGTVGGWAEVDLTKEFNLPPGADAHFMMTTGKITPGQAALYVAEVNSGQFAVYTMIPSEGPALSFGIQIRRHDLTRFRPGLPPPGAPAKK